MHGLTLGTPSDAHECELGQGFEACYIALGILGEERPLLLDFLELPRFCEPGDRAAGDKPATAAALHARIGLLRSGRAKSA